MSNTDDKIESAATKMVEAWTLTGVNLDPVGQLTVKNKIKEALTVLFKDPDVIEVVEGVEQADAAARHEFGL